MATLDATISGESSNSYVATVADAETLVLELKSMPVYAIDFTGWDAATEATKIVALIEATTRLDRCAYVGDRHIDLQGLEWPRNLTGDRRLDYLGGTANAYPRHLKLAQVAEAAAVLTARVANDLLDRGVISESVGAHSVQYDKAIAQRNVENVSIAAQEILRVGRLLRGRVATVYRPRV